MKIITADRVNDFHMVDLKRVKTNPNDTPISDHDIILITSMKVPDFRLVFLNVNSFFAIVEGRKNPEIFNIRKDRETRERKR